MHGYYVKLAHKSTALFYGETSERKHHLFSLRHRVYCQYILFNDSHQHLIYHARGATMINEDAEEANPIDHMGAMYTNTFD